MFPECFASILLRIAKPWRQQRIAPIPLPEAIVVEEEEISAVLAEVQQEIIMERLQRHSASRSLLPTADSTNQPNGSLGSTIDDQVEAVSEWSTYNYERPILAEASTSTDIPLASVIVLD